MFDTIAPTYDRLNTLLSFNAHKRWRKKAAQLLGTSPIEHILDVATGTGDFAIDLHQYTQAQIIGIDISAEMLRLAEEKIKQLQLNRHIRLQKGDVSALPFEDNQFDVVSSAFGVRNFENLIQGLTEMRRVLKPGGQIIILEFSQPRSAFIRCLYRIYQQLWINTVSRLFFKNNKAYHYLNKSAALFPSGKKFCQTLRRLDFKNPRYISLSLGVCSIYIAKK